MAAQAILFTDFGGSSGYGTGKLCQRRALGVIAQDPLLAQHVLCISSMSLVPITRPCIGIDLCNPGTTSGHFAIGGEDECTSRLQKEDNIAKD